MYAVLSRRARGVSLGVNLNPNDACNFRCVYCQVPGLRAGGAPPLDLPRLGSELDELLTRVLRGAYLSEQSSEDARTLRDVAFSGNGEPTSCRELGAAIELVAEHLEREGLRATSGEAAAVRIRLISNGSLVDKPYVRAALSTLAAVDGEQWLKVDRAVPATIAQLNGYRVERPKLLDRAETAARLCPTWLQTCWFALDGAAPSAAEADAYVALLGELLERGTPLLGVQLYSLARPSHQPEAPRLSACPPVELERFAERLRPFGIPVIVA